MARQTQPIGIELAKRNIITESDINKVINYQKEHSDMRIGEIINELHMCDSKILIEAIGDIIGEKGMLLTQDEVKVNILEYISLDIAKRCEAVPFDLNGTKVKVCFADTTNDRLVNTVRLLLFNKGYDMEKYVTFRKNIHEVLDGLGGKAGEGINTTMDIVGLVDSIIKTGMDKRASDIHFEPQDNVFRVRYRIDGQLITAVEIDKEKQPQIIGRLKAISNMHQEKQEDQDGRILNYPEYNIRVSSQRNIYGEKFVLRLLKKNAGIKTLFDLGFPNDPQLIKDCFNKKNSITIIAAPTGSGKTTTLYAAIDMLNAPNINITTIEDPVEIRIPGLNQVEIDEKTTFANSLRTILRQDPNIILVGEIRDKETAEIAFQSGQTGHYVLSTIHTINAVEVITRLRKMGISNYDIASTLATCISQRLVRRVCPKCGTQRDFTDREKEQMQKVVDRYDIKLDFTGAKTFTPTGCDFCNHTGFYERIGVFEELIISQTIKEMIADDKSSIEIMKEAEREGFRPLEIDGIIKVLNGYTTLDELNSELLIF